MCTYITAPCTVRNGGVPPKAYSSYTCTDTSRGNVQLLACTARLSTSLFGFRPNNFGGFGRVLRAAGYRGLQGNMLPSQGPVEGVQAEAARRYGTGPFCPDRAGGVATGH